MTKNDKIARLEARKASLEARMSEIGARAKTRNRLFTAGEGVELDRAIADVRSLTLAIQHEKAVAGAFRSQAY